MRVPVLHAFAPSLADIAILSVSIVYRAERETQSAHMTQKCDAKGSRALKRWEHTGTSAEPSLR